MTLQRQIVAKFLEKLSKSKDLDDEKIQQIEKLLSASKRPKSDDFVKVFSQPAGGDLK